MKPLLAGVTGGIGSGKSIVCRILEIMGIPVYNADNASKNLLENDKEIVNAVKHLLGSEAYDLNGKANRAKIAEIVFNDPGKLKSLNAILHPAVRENFRNWVKEHERYPILAKEAAILFESGSYLELDFTIAVTAPDSIRVRRVMERDGKSAEAVYKIINEQLPQQSLTERSNFVIINDEEHLVIPQVLELIAALKQQRVKP